MALGKGESCAILLENYSLSGEFEHAVATFIEPHAITLVPKLPTPSD
jgi:hypothetical protein